MKRLIGLTGLFLIFILAGMIYAVADEYLQNGTFDADLSGWSLSPEPDPVLEEEYITWVDYTDEYTGAALLLPYYQENDYGIPIDTDTILSQVFLLPGNSAELSFDMIMEIAGPGHETDIFSVILNGNLIYQLTSSQVNEAAMNNDTHVIGRDIDADGLLQFAKYRDIVITDVSNLAGENVNLIFTLHNDNADNCVSCVYIDNVEVLPDTTPPSIEIGGMTELWPPNHKYHTFKLSDCVSVMDNVDEQMDVDELGRIISIYSDEPEEVQGNGDGNTYDDIVILSDYEFKVRSERQGTSNGRVYGVTFEISDQSGNQATATFYLGVPHDQSGDPPVDSGAGAGYTVINAD